MENLKKWKDLPKLSFFSGLDCGNKHLLLLFSNSGLSAPVLRGVAPIGNIHHDDVAFASSTVASSPLALQDACTASELGRGNRRRKRRRFFDEDVGAEDRVEESRHIAHAKKLSRQQQQQQQQQQPEQRLQPGVNKTEVRRSVFQPGYEPDPDSTTSSSQRVAPAGAVSDSSTSQLNAVFVCQKVPSVSRRRFSSWMPGEVASLVRTLLPYLGEQVSQRLVEEEVDGEAFLMLTQADLVRGLGLKLGPALKLYNAIMLVKSTLEG